MAAVKSRSTAKEMTRADFGVSGQNSYIQASIGRVGSPASLR